jgi:hypothetical protein
MLSPAEFVAVALASMRVPAGSDKVDENPVIGIVHERETI